MNVIIADHNAKARTALAALLCEQPGIMLVSEVAEFNSLLALIENQVVDVIMLEYGLPGVDLTDLIGKIHAINRYPRIVVMSTDPENARLALNAGADFFVSKSNQPEWLLDTIRRCER